MYSSTTSTGASAASASLSSPSSSSFAARHSLAPAASYSASSSLYNFSSYPSYAPPSSSSASSLASELDGAVYRGIDHSSSIFATPPSPPSSAAAALSLHDFDSALDSSHASTLGHLSSSASAFASHYSVASSSHSRAQKKLDIPAFASLTDLSASDFPLPFESAVTAAPAPKPTPIVVSSEPSYLERYTSFYSATPAEQLLPSLSSLLAAHHIDHSLVREKAKLVVSFQCPFLSALTVTFMLRLYRSNARPDVLIVEGQRREGCVVAFHHVWDRLVKASRENGLCDGLVEEAPERVSDCDSGSGSEASTVAGVLGMCSLLGNTAAASSAALPQSSSHQSTPATPSAPATPLPSFQLDASSSAILTNLVDNGDILQQRDALRLLSLSLLSSPSASTQCNSFLARIARWATPAPVASSSSSHSSSPVCLLDDERTAQLARLMLICTQNCNTDAFVGQCARSLFELLDELVVRQPAEAMSLCRMRGLRSLLQVLSQLTSTEGGRVLQPFVGRHERAVLEQCAAMPDEAVKQESRAVLQGLARVY